MVRKGLRLLWVLWLPLVLEAGLAQAPQTPSRRQPSTPGAGPDRRQQEEWRRNRQSFAKPVMLSGRVVLEDDDPPPEPVKVELLCNFEVRSQTYTSADGGFNFQLGGKGSAVMDASARKPAIGKLGFTALSDFEVSGKRVNMSGCEIRALLGGFRSDTLQLASRSALDSPKVGTILLTRRTDVRGTMVSLNTLAAPKKARKAYRKARKELTARNATSYPKAIKELEKAVGVYPEFAAAWQMLGQLRLSKKDQEGAREAFSKALSSDPAYIPPYLSIAALDFRDNRWEQVDELSMRVLKLDPETLEAYYYHGVANYYLGKLNAAKKSALKVSESHEVGRYPLVHFLMGSIHAQEGNFGEAASEYRRLLRLEPDLPFAGQLRHQLTTWRREGIIQSAPSVGD